MTAKAFHAIVRAVKGSDTRVITQSPRAKALWEGDAVVIRRDDPAGDIVRFREMAVKLETIAEWLDSIDSATPSAAGAQEDNSEVQKTVRWASKFFAEAAGLTHGEMVTGILELASAAGVDLDRQAFAAGGKPRSHPAGSGGGVGGVGAAGGGGRKRGA